MRRRFKHVNVRGWEDQVRQRLLDVLLVAMARSSGS